MSHPICSICDICSISFRDTAEFNKHYTTHTSKINNALFVCHLGCTNSFITKEYLISHLQTHTQSLPFKCDYDCKCKRSFSNKNALLLHMKKHTDYNKKLLDLIFDDLSRDELLSSNSNTMSELV